MFSVYYNTYVRNNMLNKATGEHFNSIGNKMSYMKVTIVEQIHSSETAVRKEREKYFIQNMNTKYKGLNKKT